MKVRLLSHNNTISEHIIITDTITGNNWIANGIAIIHKKEMKDKMIYYNQYDKKWADIPYPSNNHPKATIQTSGCGTTAVAMILATLVDKKITPIDTTKYSLKNGYRALEGTSEALFPALAKKYKLNYKETYSRTEMLSELKKGRLIICLMSSWFKNGTGHYIVAHKIVGKAIKIKDPASTFNSMKIYSETIFKQKGMQYFIFSKPEKVDEYVEAIKYLDKNEMLDGKYWLPKRKIDKYFEALIVKIYKKIKK